MEYILLEAKMRAFEFGPVTKQMAQPPQADCCLRGVCFLIFMGILLTSEWAVQLQERL